MFPTPRIRRPHLSAALALLALSACSGSSGGFKVYNTPPGAVIEVPSEGATFDPGEVITFEGLVNDSQESPEDLAISWVSDRDGLVSEDPADSSGYVVFRTSSLSSGLHIITLKAVDSDAAEGEDWVQIAINDGGSDPEIAIRSPVGSEMGVEDSAFTFEVVVQDEQDAPQDLYVWMSSDQDPDGEPFCELNADEAGVASCDAVLAVGIHNLLFEVEDTDGNHATAERLFEVMALSDLDEDGDGSTVGEGDCNDTDSSVYPGATEVANGVDDDCDDIIDETTSAYDDDGDCFCEIEPCVGSSSSECVTLAGLDCDDLVPSTHPGATEICDSADNDCDTAIDEGTSCTDDDGDGYSELDGDCDDSLVTVHPGAPELADTLDNDCDGTADEGTELYDDDGDCYCETAPCTGSSDATCTTLAGGDCADSNDDISPAAAEVCDGGTDNDCDGSVDEASATDAASWYRDADTDGFGNASLLIVSCYAPSGYVANDDDCNDAAIAISPAATEVCDLVDNDCDAGIDEGVQLTFYRDADADTYGLSTTTIAACTAPTGYVANATDCDDTRNTTYPGATEYCNSRDDDCDTTIDENSAADALTWYRDVDGDTYGGTTSQVSCTAPSGYVSNSLDCNDSVAAIRPGASEYCDLVDNDCDSSVDESSAVDASTWYRDSDSDGYGSLATSTRSCNSPVGYVSNSSDCNDGSAGISPGATEVCDGADNDCDASTDEGVTTTYYRDADSDTYGSPTVTIAACTLPSGYVTNNTDCNDSSASINPLTRWYRDADSDTYGSTTVYVQQCTQPTGYVSNNTDCNDSSSSAYPGRTEACDSIDNDCDGTTDEASATGCSTYYYDYDRDGYGTTSSQCLCAGSGYYTASVNTDCYDTNSNAKPGATSYYSTSRGDSSFDYNCDSTETKRYTTRYSCSAGFTSCGETVGWEGSVPACGVTANWVTDCYGAAWVCLTDVGTQTQTCR